MMTTLCNALGFTIPKLLEASTDAQLEVARCALATMIPGKHTATAFDAVMREIHRRRAGILPGHSGVCSPDALCGKCQWFPEQAKATLSVVHPDGTRTVIGTAKTMQFIPTSSRDMTAVEIDPARQLMPVYRGGVDPVTEGIQEGPPRLSRSIHQTPGTTARVVKCHALWSAPSSITGVRARHVCQEPMGHNPPCRCTCKAETLEPASRPATSGELEDLDLGPLPWACELCGAPCAAENGVICGACRRKGGITVADLETAATLAAGVRSPPFWEAALARVLPDGWAWICPDCGTQATLGENAFSHHLRTKHGLPTAQDLTPSDYVG